MPNAAFSFGEAELWIKPSGLNSVSAGYVRTYSLERTPVTLEDGSASFYRDRFSFESPWIDPDATTLYYARGPFDQILLRWRNEDDGRLESVALSKIVLESVRRAPGDGMVESFEFRFKEAISLA